VHRQPPLAAAHGAHFWPGEHLWHGEHLWQGEQLWHGATDEADVEQGWLTAAADAGAW
jgi:hypothetical protein